MSGAYLAPASSDPFGAIASPGKAKQFREYVQGFARVLLTATFLEDAYRIGTDYNSQVKFLTVQRGMMWSFASALLVISAVVQVGGSALLIAKHHLIVSIAGLSSILILQTVCYGYLFDFSFLIRNVSVIGSLCMLWANERQREVRSNPFNGAFTLGGGSRLTYMQLVARVLVALLFFSLIGGHPSVLRVIGGILVALPVIAIVLGYKARSSAAVLAVFLLVSNVAMNGFFFLEANHPERDFKKYYFFQTLTVTGGLLVLTEMGAGGLSLDERGKDL